MNSEELKCVFCREAFVDKETLQIHFRKHGDKNFHDNKTRFHDDSLQDKAGHKDQAEMVECDVCPEVFTSISKAITHKHKVHPDHDAKYFCPWCGKLFTMKHLFNKHINTAHPNAESINNFHCDVCNVAFNELAAVTYHNKFFHRIQEMPTTGNSKKLKIIFEESVQLYYCPFCGEEYDNKINLHKHMGDDHIDENQHPDDVLRCPVCDAIFYHLDAYELHLTYHSIDDVYSETSALMDEITDFSLETVPPIAEKVESLEHEDDRSTGIEQLFELSMDDAKYKKKKHKKHKKSKKSAITLDQFLNMNTDVFGEGLDFQGIEEVPSQIIAKRLKRPVKKLAQSKLPPNIEKLKQQGIVIKKKGTPVKVHPSLVKTNDIVTKPLNTVTQNKPSGSTTNDVLTKLNLNNSQIKIVKKSNLQANTNEDNKETQNKTDLPEDEKISEDAEVNEAQASLAISKKTEQALNTLTQNKLGGSTTNDVLTKLNLNNSQIKVVKKSNLHANTNIDKDAQNKTNSPENEKVSEDAEPNEAQSPLAITKENEQAREENSKTDEPKHDTDAYPNNTSRKTILSPQNKTTCSDDEASNQSRSVLDDETNLPQTKIESDVVDKLSALRSNSNIVIKSSQQSAVEVIPNKDSDHSNDDDISDHDEHAQPEDNENSTKINSLDVIKHLSHLIVKSCGQDGKPAPKELNNTQDKKIENPDVSKIAHLIRNSPAKFVPNTTKSSPVIPLPDVPTSLKSKVVEEENNFDTDEELDDHNENYTSTKTAPTEKLTSILNNTSINIKTKKQSLKITPDKQTPTEILNLNEKSSSNLLKHLKNVTAKPIGVNKTVNIVTTSPKMSPKPMNTVKKEPVITPPVKHSKVIEKDIEIFNIDDSDSDEANCNTHHSTNQKNKETPKSADVLKNINKNIIIKSVNKQNTSNVSTNKVQIKEFDNEGDYDEDDNETHSPLPNKTQPKFKPQINQKQSALNNVLKNLSKNITVKSGNTDHFSEDRNSQDFNSTQDNEEVASDSESLPDRVKITEMHDASEEDDTEHTNVTDTPQDNVKVQYPDDSNSDSEDKNDNEDFVDFSDEDLEKHITANTVKNNTNSASIPNLHSFKNVCKDLVIRPSGQSRTTQPSTVSDEIPPFAKSLSNQMSKKNKQVKLNNTNSKDLEQTTTARSINKAAHNQVMASTSNQVNTVNKEVKTVKTFQTQTQTKTVIQEITTTVTKTIKTVNQSVKQEIRNTNQSSFTPHKIQQGNINFQGVKVRPSMPIVGPRVRNPGMRPTRPVVAGPIRPSNQLVPTRPRFNAPRQCNPRMQGIGPSTSGQIRQQKAPLIKVGHSVTTTPKRPNTEAPGHFSCFKKPKESLFPDIDLPIAKNEGESSVQFSSAMQMSKSNFACTTKTVKGNNVVTSTQMKSEMSASSQQLGKLRNLSGLSVMKTSQASQSHVEEKNEKNVSKQNTLDAIQRLQSQGLLVKKPRIISESNHSNPPSENDDEDNGS